jgi:hypothetical protein
MSRGMVLRTKDSKGVGRVKKQTRKDRTMKIKYLRTCILLIATGGLVSGCVVEPNGQLGFQPVVIGAPAPVYVAPAPVVIGGPPAVYVAPVTVMVPDSYVWDGYENVGLVGGQYFYLGPGNVWLAAEPWRLDRFHGWERDHPDWRDHAIRNDRFRRDAHGHDQPRHDEKGGGKAAPEKKKEDQH